MLLLASCELEAHEPLLTSGALVMLDYAMIRVAIRELGAHEPLLTSGALVVLDYAMPRVAICVLDAHERPFFALVVKDHAVFVLLRVHRSATCTHGPGCAWGTSRRPREAGVEGRGTSYV